jgi:hypothetical protein
MSEGTQSSSSHSQSYTKEQRATMAAMLGYAGGESGLTDYANAAKEIAALNKAQKPIPPELQAKMDNAVTTLRGTVYQGDRVAPFSTLQNQAVAGASNYSDYFATPETTTTPMFGETGTALNTLLQGKGGATDFTGAKQFTPQDTANYFKGAIYDPTMKSLNQDVNPATQEAFAGPGFYGAARSQALQKNATDTADTLNTQRANLEWGVTQQNQSLAEAEANRRVGAQEGAAGRMQNAVSQGMAYSQLPAQETAANIANAASKVQGLSQIFGFGQAEQTQEQVELQSDIQKFMEENQILDPQIQELVLQLLGTSFSHSGSHSYSQNIGIV